jgi:hypothetical protein
LFDYSQDFEFYFDYPKTRKLARFYTPEFQQWILRRGVRLSSLASYPKCERVLEQKDIFKKVIEATGSRLRILHTHMDFDMVMVAVRKHCPLLERLECGKGGKRGGVGKLLSKCPRLQHLVMKSTDASSVESMKQYGKQLRSLRMASEYSVGSQQIPDWAGLVPCVPNLTSLEIGEEGNIGPLLTAVAQHCPHLRILRITNWQVGVHYTVWSDLLLTVAKGCPSLEELSLSQEGQTVDDEAMAEIFRLCKNLASLRLESFWNTSDAMLLALARDVPRLRHLSLKYINWVGVDSRLATVVISWPLLESLCLKRTLVQDKLLFALAVHCPHLLKLWVDDCRQVTDAGVTALAKGCRELQHVHLSHCPEFTVAAPQAIVASCQCRDRLILTLYDAPKITPAEAQPYLRYGDINHINFDSRKRKRKKKEGAVEEAVA